MASWSGNVMMIASGDWMIPVVILAVIAVFFFLFLLRTGVTYPYEKIDQLCTKTELRFYQVLRDLVGDRFEIFSKVRIADLLKVKSGTRKRMSWQNRINCKHIDFVLCDRETLEPLVAIELDDRSHQRQDRVKRDEFVNQAFEDAGFPILRIRTSDKYDQGQIDKSIQQATNSKNRNFIIHVD